MTSDRPVAGLAGWDALILGVYLGGVLLMSWLFARRQRTGEDYFLAGRSMTGLPLALSILANQASAVSLVGAPAFVALREGGGLRWLQYELALPLAMLAVIAFLLPALRSVRGASVYAFLEDHFGTGTRRAVAGAFVLSRGLSLGVVLYASALVVAETLGWPVERALVVVGIASVAYTSLGGIVADIWSDVAQLVLLWAGVLASSACLLWRFGAGLLAAVPPERSRALVLDAHGLGDGATFAFLPMLLGGFFLYASYYGCDQSQAQRLLAARDDGAARRALLLNGLLRFPLVLTYCLFGVLLAGLLRSDPALGAAMQGRPADSLVPVFLGLYLPPGLRGLLIAAILAAAMSSIDSALNSLAAVTLEDILGRAPTRRSVWLGRGASLGWGVFAVGSGLAFARSGAGVLELVNLVGSIFYGPVLGVFFLGVLGAGGRGSAALGGLALGLAGTVAVASCLPGVSWLWWNPLGFGLTLVSGLALSGGRVRALRPVASRLHVGLLGGAFAAIFGLVAWIG